MIFLLDLELFRQCGIFYIIIEIDRKYPIKIFE